MSTKLAYVCGAAALVSCLMATGAQAAQDPPVQLSPQPRIQMQPAVRPELRPVFSLTCRVQGTPVEFPNDIAIINNGPGTVPAGTKLHWSMTKPALQGDYVLGSPLAPNTQTFVNGVIPGGLPAGMPCGVKVVQ